MFCHDRYSLLSSERKNSTIVSTRARKRWGKKREEREKAHRLHHDRICVWWMGNISDAFAGVPCLTPRGPHASPYRFRTILLLALSLSAVSAPASPDRPSSKNQAPLAFQA